VTLPASNPRGAGGSSPEAARLEANHTSSLTEEVKRACSYNAAPHSVGSLGVMLK